MIRVVVAGLQAKEAASMRLDGVALVPVVESRARGPARWILSGLRAAWAWRTIFTLAPRVETLVLVDPPVTADWVLRIRRQRLALSPPVSTSRAGLPAVLHDLSRMDVGATRSEAVAGLTSLYSRRPATKGSRLGVGAWRMFRFAQRAASRMQLGRRLPILRSMYWAAHRRLKPTRVRALGGWVEVHPADVVIADALRERGVYEPLASAVLEALLRPDDVFLDIGANIGYHSIVAARILGSAGAVVAVEPELENVAVLEHNLSRWARCRTEILACAAGAEDGTVELFPADTNRGDHRTWEVPGRPSTRVPMRRLDNALTAMGLRPDVVKIDVQGYEAHVIEGLRRVLSGDHRLVLFSELWAEGLRGAGSSPQAYVASLRGLGLDLYRLDDEAGLLPFDDAMLDRADLDANVVGLRGVVPPTSLALPGRAVPAVIRRR